MKKIIISIAVILSLGFAALLPKQAEAQAPKAFKYQAVVKSSNGQVLTSRDVNLRISIVQGDEDGLTVYSETHFITTGEDGIIHLEIGNGLPETGRFSEISWAEANHYIKIEIDETGGMNFKDMGTTKLLSVPYAMYADFAGSVNAPGLKLGDINYGLSLTSPVNGLGTTTPIGYNDPNYTTRLDARFTGTDKLTYGSKIGMYALVDVQGTNLIAEIYGQLARGQAWSSAGNAFGVTGTVLDLSKLSGQSDKTVCAVGGNFETELNNPVLGGMAQYMAGVRGVVKGATNNYPQNGAVTGVLGIDKIKSANSYAGYFEGKGYFEDKLTVQTTDPEHNPDEPIFEIKNSEGITVFAVYENGVEILINDDQSGGSKSGFAVGGFSTSKTVAHDYMRIDPMYTQFYVYDDPAKAGGSKSGFAVGGFSTSKGEMGDEFLSVTPGTVNMQVYEPEEEPDLKLVGNKGGFAVAGISASKTTDPVTIMELYEGTARFYVDDFQETAQKAIGGKSGFAVGGFRGTKTDDEVFYFTVSPDLVEVSVDEDIVSTKSGGSKSGFAVGGFSTSKGESTYMEVNETDASFYVELLQQFTQNKKAMDETIENQQEIISKLTLANTQKEEEINLLKTELQEIKNMLEK